MYVARRPLMHHAIEEADVPSNTVVKRERRNPEVVIRKPLIETASFELGSYMLTATGNKARRATCDGKSGANHRGPSAPATRKV